MPRRMLEVDVGCGLEGGPARWKCDGAERDAHEKSGGFLRLEEAAARIWEPALGSYRTKKIVPPVYSWA